jgi:hypothetical protein
MQAGEKPLNIANLYGLAPSGSLHRRYRLVVGSNGSNGNAPSSAIRVYSFSMTVVALTPDVAITASAFRLVSS